MAVNNLLVKSYATTIYLIGLNSLANVEATRPEYVEPVKKHAASTFYIDDIDSALSNGWVTPSEHADTLAYKTAEDPQNRYPLETSSSS